MEKTQLAQSFVVESCQLLDQSMLKINHCLSQLDDDQVWWRPDSGAANAMNSVGNLLLHLAGNLKQWGVIPLTGDLDRRQREAEFSSQNSAVAIDLLESLQEVVDAAKKMFQTLTESDLLRSRLIQGFEVSTLGAIVHTTSHFVGHTHQIIQLTRLQLGDAYQFHWSPETSADGDLPI